jgi:CRP/FNR family cyclic AMP-dependent transcriptional regulator
VQATLRGARNEKQILATPPISTDTSSQDSLAVFFEHCPRRVYPPNATIITPGDQSSTLYYIIDGSVSVLIEDDDGHEIILAYLNAGDFFGEIGMFDERGERSAWVRARSKSEIAQLGYDHLRELTEKSPHIILAMLSQMSLRVRDTSRKVGDLAFKDVLGRIAGALLDLCSDPDALRTSEGIEIKITRQELGRIVGCSREMASRVLKSLKEQHLLSIAGKTVIIRGRRGLSASTHARD